MNTHRIRRGAIAFAAALACTGAVASAASASTWTNVADALAIDVNGASTAPGAPVIQWYVNGGANQKWDLQQQSGQVGQQTSVVNENSGECLATDKVAGDGLFQLPCSWDRSETTWIVIRDDQDNGNVTFVNPASGLVADVSNYSYAAGATIVGWPSNGGRNQSFSTFG